MSELLVLLEGVNDLWMMKKKWSLDCDLLDSMHIDLRDFLRDSNAKGMTDDDLSDEDINVNELEKRMWMDQIHYSRIKVNHKASE